MKQTCIAAALVLTSMIVTAQPSIPMDREPVYVTYTSHEVNARPHSDTSLYKRKSEWRQIVDQFWGPGLPRSQKQRVFDTFTAFVHDRYPGFGGLNINWDSHWTMYAGQITDSTSRGGFSAILSRFAHDLRDHHIMAWDTIMQSTPLNPGVPIFVLGANFGDVRHFGAVLTPLPDSSLVVVSSVPAHPLGLERGDVILGYEGIPWKRLVFELLDSPLPRMGPMGSAESSRLHVLLSSAGLNWHLFDTIDVVRHRSGLIDHLPTASISSLDISEFLANSEQLPVAGVDQPDFYYFHLSGAVTHGVIQGTNIGYVYLSKHSYSGVSEEFRHAVSSLMETDGMVIDIRFNVGGYLTAGPQAGLAILMNYSTETLIGFVRSSPQDLYGLSPVTPAFPLSVEADLATVYGRPIAVLVGPYTISMGDVSAYQFRYLPNARFFGRSVNGALSGITDSPVAGGFWLWCPSSVLADHRDPNTLLIRREFPIDEPVWLDKDDVAQGDDTVVKRALGWITSVPHTHGMASVHGYYRPGLDTVRLTASVENPRGHTISAIARFMEESTAVDSTLFLDDGLHGDGAADDGIWGTSWVLPPGERFYTVTTRVIDPADPATYAMPYAARFTTAGPVEFEHLAPTRVSANLVRFDNPAIRNRGSSARIPALTGTIVKLDRDTVVDRIYNSRISFGEIPPDTSVTTTRFYSLTLKPSAPDTVRYELAVEFAAAGFVYWRDTLAFVVGPVTDIAERQLEFPERFELGQNYPNPFNASTIIAYSMPGPAHVRLTVYDMLGREVAVLIDERKDAGLHEARFDASNLSSGVYLYRLQSEGFVRSLKMLLMR